MVSENGDSRPGPQSGSLLFRLGVPYQKANFENKCARTELGWEPASNRQRLLDEGIGDSLQAWLAACQLGSDEVRACAAHDMMKVVK